MLPRTLNVTSCASRPHRPSPLVTGVHTVENPEANGVVLHCESAASDGFLPA